MLANVSFLKFSLFTESEIHRFSGLYAMESSDFAFVLLDLYI